MGSTNKTTSLQLPQWIGTDKPTFLGDLNDAFLKIDNGYSEIDENATTAVSQAGQAVSKATYALGKAETAQQTAETAQTTATTANQTANNSLGIANNANSSATTANNSITSLKNWITGNLIMNEKIQVTRGVANYNKDLSILNLMFYSIVPSSIKVNDVVCTLPQSIVTALNLTENRTLSFIGSAQFGEGGFLPLSFVLRPNGDLIAQVNVDYSRCGIQCVLITTDW